LLLPLALYWRQGHQHEPHPPGRCTVGGLL